MKVNSGLQISDLRFKMIAVAEGRAQISILIAQIADWIERIGNRGQSNAAPGEGIRIWHFHFGLESSWPQ